MSGNKNDKLIPQELIQTKTNSLATQNLPLHTINREYKEFFDFCQNFYPSQVNEYGLIFDHNILQKRAELILEENQEDLTLAKFKVAFPVLFKIFEQTYDLKGIQRKKMNILIEEFIRVQKAKSSNSTNELQEFEKFIYQKVDKNQVIDFKEIQNCVQLYQQKNQKLPKKLKKIYQLGSDISDDTRHCIQKYEKDFDEITNIYNRVKQYNIIPINYELFLSTFERIQKKEKKLMEFLKQDVKNIDQMHQIIKENKDVTGGSFRKLQTVAKQFLHNMKIIRQIEEGKKKLYKSNFEKQKEFFMQNKIQFPFIFQVFEDNIEKLSQYQIEFDLIMQSQEEVDLIQINSLRERISSNYIFSNRLSQNIDNLINNIEKFQTVQINIDKIEKIEENIQMLKEIKEFLPLYYQELLQKFNNKVQKLKNIQENILQDEIKQIGLAEFLFGSSIEKQMTSEKLCAIQDELTGLGNSKVYQNLKRNNDEFQQKILKYSLQNWRNYENEKLINIIEELLQYKFYTPYLLEFKKELLNRVKIEYYFKVFFDKFTHFNYKPDLEILIKFIKILNKDYESIEKAFDFLWQKQDKLFDKNAISQFQYIHSTYFHTLSAIDNVQSQQDIKDIIDLEDEVKKNFKENTEVYKKLLSNDKIFKAYKLIHKYNKNYNEINKKFESLKLKVYEQQIVEETFDELHSISDSFEECKQKQTFITVAEVDSFEYINYFNDYCQNIYCNALEFKNQLIDATNFFKQSKNYHNVHFKSFVYLDIFFVVQYMGIVLQDSLQLQSFLQSRIEGYKRCFFSKKTFNSLQNLIMVSQQNRLNSKYTLQLIKQKNIYIQFCEAVKKIKSIRGFVQQKYHLTKYFLKEQNVSDYNITLKKGQIQLKLKPLINKSQFADKQNDQIEQQTDIKKPQKLQIKKTIQLNNFCINDSQKKICICRNKFLDSSDQIVKVENCSELYHKNCLGLNYGFIGTYKCCVCSFIEKKEDKILDYLLERKIEFNKFQVLSKCSIVLKKFMISENIDFINLHTKKMTNLIKKIKKYENQSKISYQNLHNFVACYLDLPFRSKKIEQSLYKLSKKDFQLNQFQ